MKICAKCKKEKASDQFRKDLKAKDGLCCYCKDCIWLKNLESERKRFARDGFRERPEY